MEFRVARVGVPRLTAWGVSADADLVYRTLAEHGPQSEDELRQALGLPANRTRMALDELAGTDAVRPTSVPRRVRKWAHRPPDEVVAGLRDRRRVAALAGLGARRRLATLADLDPDHRGTAARPLYGAARVRSRIAELVRVTNHEHLSMHPEPAFAPAAVRAAAPLDHDLLARDVRLLTLGVPPVDDMTAAYSLNLAERGARYRELPALPTKAIIFDRHTALLPLDPAGTTAGALELTAPDAVRSLAAWFLRRWDLARVPRSRLVATVRLTDREREIIALLAAGHTDASAAAQLGLSLRTVAYTIRGLMDRYGAQNRFQLGMVVGATRYREPDPEEN